MKQILFLSTILILFINPVSAQNSACLDTDYDCQVNQSGNEIKANPDAESLKKAVNYFAKDQRAFLYSDRVSCSLPKPVIAEQTTISKSENFALPTEEF